MSSLAKKLGFVVFDEDGMRPLGATADGVILLSTDDATTRKQRDWILAHEIAHYFFSSSINPPCTDCILTEPTVELIASQLLYIVSTNRLRRALDR